MQKTETDPRILEQINKLEKKYEVMGQDLSSYLDGLLYADYLTYWDYIHLDTLLSLQSPKTSFPDEKVFIIYHQITELYFRMVLLEMEQISENQNITSEFFISRLNRIIRYFKHLINSFDIMVDGMEPEQFLKFRMSLLPSSGFQSAQYRLIEIASTNLINLVDKEVRNDMQSKSIAEQIENLYWRKGATELASGKKTLTLRQFENKYTDTFNNFAIKYREVNLLKIYEKNFSSGDQRDEIIELLKSFDQLVNVQWPLAHYKSAVRYLHKKPEDIKATGGTNWQKYLPPRFQLVMFFPDLWSAEEKQNWGKPQSSSNA